MLRKFCLPATLSLLLFVNSLSSWGQKAPDIPPGTTIKVRMIDSLSSGKAQTGDTFHATLEQPIMVEGKEIYPKGADVTGRVADVKQSGRLSEPGELQLVLATIASGNRASSVASEPLVINGGSHTKSNATKIGGGAALGALIGAVAAGGKGAAIGAGVGGAAGTGAAAATGKKEAVVESEAVLSFVSAQSSNVSSPSPSPAATENSNTPPAPNPERSSAPSSPHSPNQESENAGESNSSNLFTARDRRVIRNCVAEHQSELPTGATQREELPAGNERQVRPGGTLPAEVEKKAQALPLACEKQLKDLPPDLERVIYNGRVLLINDSDHIIDMFYLDETQ